MGKTRKIERIVTARPTIEGAGVHLKRVFGFGNENIFDPFLLLDDFRSSDPASYLAGFPWHPHRGIETITYIIEGSVEHGDSMGNSGRIGPGDLQWMTAGSGIIHQEMPKGDESGRMGGFQLWANLPASQKMMPPRYRDVLRSTVPEKTVEGGAAVRVIAGEIEGTRGPVRDIVIDPEYLDVNLPEHARFGHEIPSDRTVFAYVIEGECYVGREKKEVLLMNSLVLFGAGEEVELTAGKAQARFLLVSGRPLREPVAWYGPIVMNTRAELETAMEEYRNGTFIKG